MATPGAAAQLGVSVREAEVLAAVGDHLTNAEIAARLVISVRTVESHVSSLLRKLQVDDRRALAALAASTMQRTSAGGISVPRTVAALPSPLTPFVGRVQERATLAEALQVHRLVTAVGPGGVGKTRLALSVAADMADRFTGGVWYVDLVPVTDPAMIAPAIADALGLGEPQSRSTTDHIVGWLADREALLILDNCEHMLDGLVVLLERLLIGTSRLVMLATSRARLLVPFEWVFPVPGLSVRSEAGGPADAVQLFLERAASAASHIAADDYPRVAAICSALDGMALSIELAAARFASLGLDGLEVGLHDRLTLLAGGSRVDDRHRSLRSTLDWSYALLEDADQAVLRRVSVFAGPFRATTAAALLADWSPVPGRAVATVLADLADQSLLVASIDPGGTRYRALETIRQYGLERLHDSGELLEALTRHLRWCETECVALSRASHDDGPIWRVAFDQTADELRAALAWAATTAEQRPRAHRLALGLAELTFRRGMPGESQHRYDQAAQLAPDDLAAAAAWRNAAGAAESRHVGTDALRLRRAAADAAVRAGDRAGAAADLARNAELINRGPGLLATEPAAEDVAALLGEGWLLAGDDLAAQARLMTAEAFARDVADQATLDLVERAITLARDVDDPLTESAALDRLTAIELAGGQVRAGLASALRRVELVARLEVVPTVGLELLDSYSMAADCAIAAGDLGLARRLAERLRVLPFHLEEGHLATSRLLVVTVMTGDWTESVGLAEQYREGWERAGRPRAGNLSRGAYAAATVHGLRGDERSRSGWLEVVDAIRTPGRPLNAHHSSEFFDAMLLLHQGHPDRAAAVMATPPEELNQWYSGLWRPWYAALWAEAAVLSGREDAADRLDRARRMSADNPIAVAIIDRAAALSVTGDDREGLIVAAAALEAAECRYQWARTLVVLGGSDRERGEHLLSMMGAAPMVWPPERGPIGRGRVTARLNGPPGALQ